MPSKMGRLTDIVLYAMHVAKGNVRASVKDMPMSIGNSTAPGTFSPVFRRIHCLPLD